MNLTAIKRKSQAKSVIRNKEIVVEFDAKEIGVAKKFSTNQLIQNQMIVFEQYTVHSFVYCPTVLRPPVAEYTSIKDCIDTDTINRLAEEDQHLIINQLVDSFNIFE